MQAYLFGLPLDEAIFHPEDADFPLPLGPSGLLRMLEGALGLALPAENREHLRLGAFREALDHVLAGEPAVFFAASFKVDPLGTAAELLARRDELLAAGWDFQHRKNTPERLAVLARAEPAYRQILARLPKPAYGEADRLHRIRTVLAHRKLPAFRLHLLEPSTCMPAHWQRLIQALPDRGTAVAQWETPAPSGNTTDLQGLQRLLADDRAPQKTRPRADGSLLLVQADTDAQLAAFFARLLERNPGLQSRVLLPGPLAQADLALIQSGLPALGSAPASLARPSQQVLKLVPAFIWDPVDPYKILEFVTLPHKPLDEKLALEIAELLARSPGLHSQQWERRINRFFREADERGERQGRADAASMRRQYRRWFERPRYPGQEAVPVDHVIPLFDELYLWAREQQAAQEGRPSAFAALAEQAQRLIELLQTQRSGLVSQRELEQMIRTVYDPTVIPLQIREAGALPVSFSAGAAVRATDQLLWWHFANRDRDPFFSRWYAEEREALEREGVSLDSPASESSRALFYEKLPLLQCRQQLILGLPKLIEGQETLPHPLLALLHARFSTLEPLTLQLGRETDPVPAAWAGFRLPGYERIAPEHTLQPPAFIRLRNPERLQADGPETYTGLEQLLYYPHQWLFQRKLRLLSSPLFRVADDATLLGSLAHRIFELLLAEEDALELDQPGLGQRVDEIAEDLLEREGAVLLMYGREPERVSFLRKVKHAAWTLVDLVKQNRWNIAGVELPLHGYFDGLEISGRLDLLLQRGEEKAVVDLKWRGKNYRRELMEKNRELQLVLYSRLVTGNAQWAHTAYFIQRDAILLARNADAFTQAQAIREDEDHTEVYQRIWEAMEATYRWRRQQLEEGKVEVRCTETVAKLDEEYGQEILEVLELPQKTHAYDSYRTLIRLFA
jgi:hypothetical protein